MRALPRALRFRSAQGLPSSRQPIEINRFGRHPQSVVSILSPAPARVAHAEPVGRTVTSAAKAPTLHERLQPVEPVAILRLPIGINAPRGKSQQVAGQVRCPHMGQDQKTGVISQSRQPRHPLRLAPAQVLIARGATPGWRTEEQSASIPSKAIDGQITEVLSNDPQSQVMVVLQRTRPASRLIGPGNDDLEADRLQFRQIRAQGQRGGRILRCLHPPARTAVFGPYGRKADQTSLRQLHQKAARRKILQPSPSIAPVPLPAQFTSQPPSAPWRVGFDPTPQPSHLLFPNHASLAKNRPLHASSLPHASDVVQQKILRKVPRVPKDRRCAHRQAGCGKNDGPSTAPASRDLCNFQNAVPRPPISSLNST